MSWSVLDVIPWNDSSSTNKRRLKASKSGNDSLDGFIEVESLQIRINFTEPTMVSRNAEDSLSINVKEEILSYDNRYNRKQIISVDVNEEQALFNETIRIDQIMDPEQLQLIQMMIDTTESALLTFFSTNIFLSIPLAGVIQMMWTMINSLQVMMLASLIKIQFPDNVDALMMLIQRLTSLDFLPEDKIDL